MSVTAGVVFTTSRTLLNDDQNTLFTDTVLLPKMTQAHRELQTKLRAADSLTLRAVTTGTVNTGQTTLVTPVTDMLEPIKLWEKISTASDSTYVEMTEQDPLDANQTPGTTSLTYWQWTQEALLFRPAANNAVTVKMLYWRLIAIPAASGDNILINNGEIYLAPRIAALAAGSLGDEMTYKICSDIANGTLNDVIKANKGRIFAPGRP